MAKTAYGMRMYRARKKSAAEMQKYGEKEYTVDSQRGTSIVIADAGNADLYAVRSLRGGEPSSMSQPMDAGMIKKRYGVDIWSGQLRSGYTTEDLSSAEYVMRMSGTSGQLMTKVQDYLTGKEDISAFTASDVTALRSAVNHARNMTWRNREDALPAMNVLSSIVNRIG